MEWNVSPEWRTPHAVRPWAESKSDGSVEAIHYGDSPEAISACLSCTRTTCTGDCFNRVQATEKGVLNSSETKSKRIVELYLSGLSMIKISSMMGISRTAVRYWLRKTNTQRPKKEKPKDTINVEDPCIKCRNSYLCKTRNWTCSEKIRWQDR